MKINEHDAGQMTKMATIPMYGINHLEIFFSGTSGPILTKLGMKHLRPKLILYFVQMITLR